MNTLADFPRSTRATQRALRINMNVGVGDGPTPLAAFDAALMDAGVANYNLLCLSSVIPTHAQVVHGRHATPPEDYGRRLYVVLSQMREDRPGRVAHAGIGWIQQESTGRGLFVELHDNDRNRLERDLRATLEAMRASRNVADGPVQTEIASAPCVACPVCALVVAVYACEPWRKHADDDAKLGPPRREKKDERTCTANMVGQRFSVSMPG
jgi:arginine decarboxylase